MPRSRTYGESELDQLKKDTAILDVLERYGVPAHRQANGTSFMALCPFHEDKNPSLSVDPVKNVWHCFGCQKGGSSIDFVMEKEGLSFKEAVDLLLTRSGVVVRASAFAEADKSAFPQPSQPSPRPARPTAPAEPLPLTPDERRQVSDVVEHYHRTLSGEDTRGLDYLRRRHIADPETLTAFKVGYSNGTLKKILPKSAVPLLQKIGLLRADGTEHFAGCVVLPVFTADGELGEMYGRRVESSLSSDLRHPTSGPVHLYLPGPHRGILNAKAAEVYPDGIILTEAAFDALTFHAHGIRNVIPCYGTGGFTPDHLSALTRAGVRKIFIAFDNDQAGEDGAKRLALALDDEEIDCHRVKIPEQLGKDVNAYVSSLYRSGMPPEEITSALKDLLVKAPRFGYRRTRTGKLTLAEHTDTELVFSAGSASGGRNGDLTYRLRGLFENRDNSLRVILTATREDASHTDRFDLYTAKSRASFTYRAANRLELPVAKIEEDLNSLIPTLETLLAEGKGKPDEPQGPPPMSEKDRDEALRLLRSKDLLGRLSADLETVGYVGEERNKQLAYLIATSRKLDKPLSAIIRSESGAGKSFLMECVAELMPEEEVQYFSRLTPQSLYYMGENELVHKLLIVDERDGSEEAEYPIRTLQTRRKLTLAVPMKDASSGKIKTTMLTINGPIAYMESSTQQTINPENLNRCFEIFLDESEKQTERIYTLQKRAHTPEGWKVDEQRAATVRRHSNAQRLLASVRVSIPYTGMLRFPASWTRGRRDHQRLLHLIEAVAFLHQVQRERKQAEDGGEYIEATVDDYTSAYGLARAAFTQALADMPRSARLVLSQIRAMVAEACERLNVSERDYGFRRRDVREHSRLPDHHIKRAMRVLEDLEYVHVRRGGRGGSFIYHLAANPSEKDPLEGLTTPDELRKSISTGSEKLVEQSGTTGCSPFYRS
jgi:DNA primase